MCLISSFITFYTYAYLFLTTCVVVFVCSTVIFCNVWFILLLLLLLLLLFSSGLGYIVGSGTASLFGSWRWGLRVTPVMGIVAVLLIIFVMHDPVRGKNEGAVLKPTTWSNDLRELCKKWAWNRPVTLCLLSHRYCLVIFAEKSKNGIPQLLVGGPYRVPLILIHILIPKAVSHHS